MYTAEEVRRIEQDIGLHLCPATPAHDGRYALSARAVDEWLLPPLLHPSADGAGGEEVRVAVGGGAWDHVTSFATRAPWAPVHGSRCSDLFIFEHPLPDAGDTPTVHHLGACVRMAAWAEGWEHGVLFDSRRFHIGLLDPKSPPVSRLMPVIFFSTRPEVARLRQLKAMGAHMRVVLKEHLESSEVKMLMDAKPLPEDLRYWTPPRT